VLKSREVEIEGVEMGSRDRGGRDKIEGVEIKSRVVGNIKGNFDRKMGWEDGILILIFCLR